MSIPVPPDEGVRIQTLYRYDVLDSAPEPAYDDLARLAATICGTPIAAVSFVDRDRVWFKASQGFDFKQVAKQDSFCTIAILDPDRVTVIEDSTQDPRCIDHSDGARTMARFYAGAPFLSPEGLPLGVLCVASPNPGSISEEQIAALQAIGRQVATQLELRMAVRRLQENAVELTHALDNAESALRTKSSFLANMSHEIRTPLNGVIGMAELLGTTALSERQRRYVETIRRSGEGLLGMLNDVLFVAQNDDGSGALDISDVVLPTLLDELVGMMQPAAESKKLWIDLEVDAQLRTPVEADALAIRQVMTSLLSNAIKFTHKGWIQVRARVTESAAGRRKVRFEVLDSGVGIPLNRQSSIFEEFVRGEDRNQAYGGLGLGLTIGSRLVRAMGAELRVESEPNMGSTFWFELDLQESKPEAQPRARRVLVVEDNEVNSLVITAMLEQNGCKVECVENGLLAIDLMRRERFDMVFMDLHMPEMDGVTATQHVRAMEATHEHTPIVAVTASAFSDEEKRCREAGMDGLIRKPINERVVRDALDRYARMV